MGQCIHMEVPLPPLPFACLVEGHKLTDRPALTDRPDPNSGRQLAKCNGSVRIGSTHERRDRSMRADFTARDFYSVPIELSHDEAVEALVVGATIVPQNVNPALLAQLPQMQERAQALTIAINSRQILGRLENQIVRKANERVRKLESDAPQPCREGNPHHGNRIHAAPGQRKVAGPRTGARVRTDVRVRVQAAHPGKLRVLIVSSPCR